MKSLIIQLIILFGLNTFCSSQSDFYVASNGSDQQTGSITDPWKTIQFAVNQLGPGDHLFVRAGNYNEQVIMMKSGDQGVPIVIQPYESESVIIDGEGLPFEDGYGIFTIYPQTYIEIRGLTFQNSGTNPNNGGILIQESNHISIINCRTFNTVSSGIATWECEDILIDNNEVELACNGGEQECITIAETNRFVVSNNIVHDSGPDLMGGEGIDIKQGSSEGEVYGNEVFNIKAVGIYIDAFDQEQSNVEVFNNKVYNIEKGLGGNQGTGILIAVESGGLLTEVAVYNNLVYDCALFGIALSDCCIEDDHPMQDIFIINNTIYHCGYDADEDGGGLLVSNEEIENVVIRNNILSDNNLFQIGISQSIIENLIVVDYNLIDGFRDIPGEVIGDHAILGEAGFVDAFAKNFELTNGSIAIDVGTDLLVPDFDYYYNSRPMGAGYDVGAFEFDLTSSIRFTEEEPSFKILPNPVKNYLTIGELALTEGLIKIVDSKGSTMLHKKYKKGEQINIANFSTGIYSVMIIDQKSHQEYFNRFAKL